mgnify:FL=1
MPNLLARINRSFGEKHRHAVSASGESPLPSPSPSSPAPLPETSEDAVAEGLGMTRSSSITSTPSISSTNRNTLKSLNAKLRSIRLGPSSKDHAAVGTAPKGDDSSPNHLGAADGQESAAPSRPSFAGIRLSLDRGSRKSSISTIPVDIADMSSAALTDKTSATRDKSMGSSDLPRDSVAHTPVARDKPFPLVPSGSQSSSPAKPPAGSAPTTQSQETRPPARAPPTPPKPTAHTNDMYSQHDGVPIVPPPADDERKTPMHFASPVTAPTSSPVPVPLVRCAHASSSSLQAPHSSSPSSSMGPGSFESQSTQQGARQPRQDVFRSISSDEESQQPWATTNTMNLVPPSAEPAYPMNSSASEMPTERNREACGIPTSTSAIEYDTRSSQGVFGTFSKRGLDVMGRLRASQNLHRRPSPRHDPSKSEARRRSLFVPILSRSTDSHKTATVQSPTRAWLDWLESPGLVPPRSTKLRGFRSSSMLSSSSSTQSLRTSPTAISPTEETPHALFGTPLRDVVSSPPHTYASSTTPVSPDLTLDDRPPLLSRAEAQQLVIPRLVTRCVESLEKWGVHEEGLYRVPGRSSHASKLRALWNLPGTDLNMAEIGPADLDVHAVCSVLKMYLRELPTSFIPHDTATAMDRICTDMVSAPGSNETALGPLQMKDQTALITQLEPHIQCIPYFEWYLLREMAEHLGVLTLPENVARTKMTLSNLALVLAPSLQISALLMMTLVQMRGTLFTYETRPMASPPPYPASCGSPTPPSSQVTPEKPRPGTLSAESAMASQASMSSSPPPASSATSATNSPRPLKTKPIPTRPLPPVKNASIVSHATGANVGSQSNQHPPHYSNVQFADASTEPAAAVDVDAEDVAPLRPLQPPQPPPLSTEVDTESGEVMNEVHPAELHDNAPQPNPASRISADQAYNPEDAESIDAPPSSPTASTQLPIAQRFSQPRSSILFDTR